MMKRFYTAIVRRRRLVLAVFALAAVLSVFAVRQVKVDYDINDYLPPESPSTTAIEVMNGAFTGGIPNMRVMVRDVTVPQALEYKEKLAAIDGVSSVAWLDDSLDVTVPLQMQDTATVESYYKDGCALFTVTVEDEKRLEAVAAVRELIGGGQRAGGRGGLHCCGYQLHRPRGGQDRGHCGGVCAVHPDPDHRFLGGAAAGAGGSGGAAILINNGTNLMFGTISFVTNAAGSILQLCGFAGLLGVPDPPLCGVPGRKPRRQRGGLHGGGPVQIHRVHPVQRPDHGHRLSGAGAHAVPDRPGSGPCAGKGRGAEPCHRVHLYARAHAGSVSVDG